MAFIGMIAGFLIVAVSIYLAIFRTRIYFAPPDTNPQAWYINEILNKTIWRRFSKFQLFLFFFGIFVLVGAAVAGFLQSWG